jgi:hypothetical protein
MKIVLTATEFCVALRTFIQLLCLILRMAKQTGRYYITGCYDNICFYKMAGNYYARAKSSLTGKRVKSDIAFKGTMHYAGLLASASKIASKVYKELPQASRGVAIYRSLTGRVIQLLKEGKMADEILCILKKRETTSTTKAIAVERVRPFSHSNLYADIVIANVFAALPQEAGIELVFMEESPP